MLKEKLVIKQYGMHQCLICNNEFKWQLELRTLTGTDFEKFEALPSDIKTEPNKCVWFNTIGKEKIEISIACPRCSYQHKTDPLPFVKE